MLVICVCVVGFFVYSVTSYTHASDVFVERSHDALLARSLSFACMFIAAHVSASWQMIRQWHLQ